MLSSITIALLPDLVENESRHQRSALKICPLFEHCLQQLSPFGADKCDIRQIHSHRNCQPLTSKFTPTAFEFRNPRPAQLTFQLERGRLGLPNQCDLEHVVLPPLAHPGLCARNHMGSKFSLAGHPPPHTERQRPERGNDEVCSAPLQ